MELTNGRERPLTRFFRRWNPKYLDHLVGIVEQPEAVIVQAIAVGSIAARRHPRAAVCIIAAPLLALAATTLVKHATTRPRPISHLLRRKGLQSFPSSHTAGKSALVWMVMRALPASRRTRLLSAAVASIDIVALGASRIADGAHWPTDTLGGAVLGIATAELVRLISGVARGDRAPASRTFRSARPRLPG